MTRSHSISGAARHHVPGTRCTSQLTHIVPAHCITPPRTRRPHTAEAVPFSVYDSKKTRATTSCVLFRLRGLSGPLSGFSRYRFLFFVISTLTLINRQFMIGY